MSRYEDRALECPHCGHRTVESVAVSLDGEAAAERRQILDGTFQRFTCKVCQETFRAAGPLIYIDFDAKLWIGVFPDPWERRWWEVEQEPRDTFQRNMIEHCPPLVQSWAPGFAIRSVFGLDSLREKLVAHAAGIDDTVLEAYKLDLLRGMGPYALGPAARPRLREVDGAEVVFFVPRPEAASPTRFAKVRVPRAEIDRIAAHRDEWASTIEALSAGPYVDLGRIFVPRPG